jgi:AcrR family transcriptional regulator
MRADARRNYERLLITARVAFAEHGADASLDDIARRAGVGPGTLYRHFPTRDALLEAVIHDWIEALRAEATELLTAPSPVEALRTWFRTVIGTVGTYRGLAAALMSSMHNEASELHASCEAMQSGMLALLARAQQSGQIRADAQASDVLLLINAITLASEQPGTDDTQVDRLLSLVMDGLCADRPAV